MWKFSVCSDNDCLHCKLNVVHQFLDGVSNFHNFSCLKCFRKFGINCRQSPHFHLKRDDKKGSITKTKTQNGRRQMARIVKLSLSASKIQKLIKSPLIATMIKMYTESLSARYCRNGTLLLPLSPRKHLIGGKSVEFFRHAIVVYRKHEKCLKFRPALCRFRQPRVPEALNPGSQIALFECESREKQQLTDGGRVGAGASLYWRPGRL